MNNVAFASTLVQLLPVLGISLVIEARWLNENREATLHDLAAEFGVSAERIRQIESKAMARMKTVIAAEA